MEGIYEELIPVKNLKVKFWINWIDAGNREAVSAW